MSLRDMYDEAVRKNAQLQATIDQANETIAQHESGEAMKLMREQRDILWLFAHECAQWSHTCRCGYHAEYAIKNAGLEESLDNSIGHVDPKLALLLVNQQY